MKEETKKKKVSKTTKQLFALALVLLLLIAGSYAWLTITLDKTKTNIIRAGNLDLILDDTTSNGIMIEKAVPMSDAKGLTQEAYTFSVKNNGEKAVSYTLYLDDYEEENSPIAEKDRMANESIRYSITKNNGEPFQNDLEKIGENPNRILESGTIEGKSTDEYTLRIWIDQDAETEVMGKIFYARLRLVAEQAKTTTSKEKNENIKAVYEYDSTNCVTGEEATCQAITPSTYKAGTIIKYAVNDSEEKYFYVLHDDGDTLTMQQRENTIYHTEWLSQEDYLLAGGDANLWGKYGNNSKGPITALTALENITAEWSNVNDQTYTMGTSTFGQANGYTGCSQTGQYEYTCNTNTYTLSERTAKARMITIQEAAAVGCTMEDSSCPNWMYNYLYNSTCCGGTVNDTYTSSTGIYNNGYWMMQASGNIAAWDIYYYGNIANQDSQKAYSGTRAVVVINK